LSVDCSPLDFHWDRLLLFVANVLSIVIANSIENSRKLIITGTRSSKKKVQKEWSRNSATWAIQLNSFSNGSNPLWSQELVR
jgi:hypothetical protein